MEAIALIKCLSENIRKNHKGIFSKFKVEELIGELSKERFDKIRPYKLSSVVSLCSDVHACSGAKTMEEAKKFLILQLVLKNWDEYFSPKYPQSIQEQFKINFERFILVCQKEGGWGEFDGEVYWKDLAIARQQMFPAGWGRVVEIFSGFGLKQGLNNGFCQSIQFLKLLCSLGGKAGYYEWHLHTPYISEFKERNHDLYSRNVAKMLEQNEQVKGVMAASWYYDPILSKVSPRLSYLHDLPKRYGAEFFCVCKDSSGNAFVRSKTRLKLYHEGKYKPKKYLMIWPRNKMISWARSTQSF